MILYDGVCVLCSFWVGFVARRDAGRHRFTPVQSPYGTWLAGALGIDAGDPQTNAVIQDGRALFKSDAALAVLGGLPWWGWVRVLRLVPRPVRDAVYDRVAGNRYRLFGRHAECAVPPPGLKARVVTERTG